MVILALVFHSKYIPEKKLVVGNPISLLFLYEIASLHLMCSFLHLEANKLLFGIVCVLEHGIFSTKNAYVLERLKSLVEEVSHRLFFATKLFLGTLLSV